MLVDEVLKKQEMTKWNPNKTHLQDFKNPTFLHNVHKINKFRKTKIVFIYWFIAQRMKHNNEVN